MELKRLPFREFIALLALLMSIVALSIDAILPAFNPIIAELGIDDSNQVQLTISVFVFGLALGQLFFGPLSDAYGRRIGIMMGLIVFVAGSLLAMLASDLDTLVLGRFLQGLGAAGPRIVSMALIRDQHVGDAMARVMSFIMMVFIAVPILAPAFGQIILHAAGWRWIFVCFILWAGVALLWFYRRQGETLPIENRITFSLPVISRKGKRICQHPVVMGHTISNGFISAGFLGYLSSSQPLLQDAYGLGDLYPVAFAVLAASIGLASFTNGQLVLKLGSERLCNFSLIAIMALSLGFLGLWSFGGLLVAESENLPSLLSLMIYLGLTLFFVGVLFGNLNARAMAPLDHSAGIGAALVGFFSTGLCAIGGVFVGQQFDGTPLNIILGFLAFSALTFLVQLHLNRVERKGIIGLT